MEAVNKTLFRSAAFCFSYKSVSTGKIGSYSPRIKTFTTKIMSRFCTIFLHVLNMVMEFEMNSVMIINKSASFSVLFIKANY